ncbi:hypothetical protein LguiA_036063 [Lonicera macranthoides]
MNAARVHHIEGRGGSRAQGLFYSRRSNYTLGISLGYERGPSERTPSIGLCAPVSDFVSSAAPASYSCFPGVLPGRNLYARKVLSQEKRRHLPLIGSSSKR